MPEHIALASLTRSILDSNTNLPCLQLSWWERIKAVCAQLAGQPEIRRFLQAVQFSASLIFVVLYIWSTYSSPAPWSWRYNLDLFLCAVFAVDWVSRVMVRTSIVLCDLFGCQLAAPCSSTLDNWYCCTLNLQGNVWNGADSGLQSLAACMARSFCLRG